MNLFNSYITIQRNWDLERKVLLTRNVMPARRLSMSLAGPILPREMQQMRRYSLDAPLRNELSFDDNFVQQLNNNVDDDELSEHVQDYDEIPNGEYLFSNEIREVPITA